MSFINSYLLQFDILFTLYCLIVGKFAVNVWISLFPPTFSFTFIVIFAHYSLCSVVLNILCWTQMAPFLLDLMWLEQTSDLDTSGFCLKASSRGSVLMRTAQQGKQASSRIRTPLWRITPTRFRFPLPNVSMKQREQDHSWPRKTNLIQKLKKLVLEGEPRMSWERSSSSPQRNTCDMRVSQVNDRPVPMEIPVTLMICRWNKDVHQELGSSGAAFKVQTDLLTAMDRDTPASSVFPRWPQNTMLTKLIMKTMSWEMTWRKKKKIQSRSEVRRSVRTTIKVLKKTYILWE